MFIYQGATAAQLPVNLRTAGNYVILAKSGISSVPTSAITGDIGVSPIDSTRHHWTFLEPCDGQSFCDLGPDYRERVRIGLCGSNS